MKLRIVLFFVFCLSISFGFSQEKFEREYKVNQDQVPEPAREFIEICEFKHPVKWYAEESNEGKTYEAKTKYQSHKYSIEFSVSGKILDIEKTVRFSKLHKDTRLNIYKSLSESFKKYRIKKVQIQYLGRETELYNAIFNSETKNENVISNYEIIVKGKKNNRYELFEVLIDDGGKIIKELNLQQKILIICNFKVR